MAWAFVQGGTGTAEVVLSASASTTTLAYAGNTVAGNRGLCFITVQGATITSVSDAKNGTWKLEVSHSYTDGTSTNVLALYSMPITTQLLTADNITVTLNTIATTGRAAILEYSGLSSAAAAITDVSVAGDSAGGLTTTPSSGTTAATTGANELVLRMYGDGGYGDLWSTPPAGTARVNNMNDALTMEYWMSDGDSGASGSTFVSSGTLNGTARWAAICAVLKIPAAVTVNLGPTTFVRQAVKRAGYF